MKVIKTTTYTTVAGDMIRNVRSESVILDSNCTDKSHVDKRNRDIFDLIYSLNPNINKTDIAALLGVSRQTIYDYIERINNTK